MEQYLPFVYMIAIFGLMYLFLIFPQKKKEKKFREMLAAIKVGDDIVTIGGVIGSVVSIKDDTIVVETGADRTKLKFEKAAVKNIIAKDA